VCPGLGCRVRTFPLIHNARRLTCRFNRTNGLLTWIGRGFGIHQLTLELIIGYIFYPITFFLGVPRHEILRVSQLLAEKLVANEFAAYTTLQAITNSDNPLSPRAYTIASYALCGFSNLGSLGIQIGVLSALAPSQGKVIARIGPSAMICGFISTLQTAGIMYVLILCILFPSLIAMSSGMLV
jgi:CNT family concentrative nucleoside transporter